MPEASQRENKEYTAAIFAVITSICVHVSPKNRCKKTPGNIFATPRVIFHYLWIVANADQYRLECDLHENVAPP